MNHIVLTSIIILLSNFGFSQKKVKSTNFDNVINGLLSHSVSEINVQQAALLVDSAMFLDAREKKEYEVSHIKDALWIGYTTFKFSRISEVPKNKPVIIYCSVGYRSEKIAERLIKKGYTKVYNLYGGLFEWSNESYPMYHENEKTSKIHGYDKNWGRWISNGEIVY